MKKMQYITTVTLALLLLGSACVKDDWDGTDYPEMLPPSQYVDNLAMDFTKESMIDGQYLVMPKGWLNTGANGTHRAFQTSVIGADYRNPNSDSLQCAAVTAYLCLGDADAWLVTPPLKVGGIANPIFYYSIFWAYTAGSTFQILCYSANSSSTTIPALDVSKWQVMADYTSASTSLKNTFSPQQQNLSNFLKAGDDIMYVAFRYEQGYLGAGSTSSTTWYVDDIKYNK